MGAACSDNSLRLDATVSSAGGQPAKRKRKLWRAWTAEENSGFIVAVKKFGERNWAQILWADIKDDRTSSHLVKRRTVISKRNNANSKKKCRVCVLELETR